MVSATFQGDDACEMAPGLRVGTNNVEIAAMMAPRPMLLVSSAHDWTRNTPIEGFPAIQSIYDLYGQRERVSSEQMDAGHNYNRDSRAVVYGFFHRFLGKGAPLHTWFETDDANFRPEQLLVGPALLPAGIQLSQQGLFAEWRESARRLTSAMDEPGLADLLRSTVGVEWPGRVRATRAGERLLLEGAASERIPATWMARPGRRMVLFIHPSGARESRVKAARNKYRISPQDSVLSLDVFQTGEAVAQRSAPHRDYLTFHRSDDANRVQDILTGLAYLSAFRPASIRLIGEGRADLWCRVAAAVAPIEVELETGAGDVAEDDVRKNLFIPGFFRAGGLSAVHRLVAAKRAGAGLLQSTE
jgi:hypothetical protein